MQLSLHPLVCRRRSSTATVAALIAAAALLLVPALASASTNYTWSGAAALGTGTERWSVGTNWEGSSAPSGTVGTLTFPALTSAACASVPPTATCYQSYNDVTGLNVNGLSIDDGVKYEVTGNAITLGAGGITAAPSASNVEFGGAGLYFPITLGAPQTWSIAGGSKGQQLIIGGGVTGSANSLAINFSNQTFLTFGGNSEVGEVTVTGEGAVAIEPSGGGGSLNGTDGNAVSLTGGAGLVAFAAGSTIGPLTTTGGEIGLGSQGASSDGTLAVDGGVTLAPTSTLSLNIDHSGTTPGTDFSQLSASGAVNLESAHLFLFGTEPEISSGGCEVLTPGDVDTIVTTTGSLTGTFSGVPNGTTVPVECASGTPSTVRINYTANTVTATVLTAGSSSETTPTTTALQVSDPTPAVGENVTYTATVTPETLGEAAPSGSVAFLDEGKPIGTCAAQPLTQGASSSTATCTLSYPSAGAHNISASYAGDTHYRGSSSTPQTVTVHQSSTGGGGGTTTPPPPATGSVALSDATVTTQSNGKAAVTLTCTGTATCGGTMTLTAKGVKKIAKRALKRAKTTTIGTATFSIPAGKSATVAVKLNSAGRALLRADHGRLRATLTITKSSPSPASTQLETVHLVQQKSGKAKRRWPSLQGS